MTIADAPHTPTLDDVETALSDITARLELVRHYARETPAPALLGHTETIERRLITLRGLVWQRQLAARSIGK